MNIVLIGFMGTGKSSVGKLVASRLGFDFADTDSLIEEQEGMQIKEIFKLKGESCFREIEAAVVSGVSACDRCVIATGGGVVLREENTDNLRKNGVIICLTANPQIILERTGSQSTRPLLEVSDPSAAIEQKLKERAGLYKGDLLLDTSEISQEAAAGRIVAFIEGLQLKPSKVAVELGSSSYDIHIGCNMLQRLDALLGRDFSGTNIMAVTNPTVYGLWGHALEEGLNKLTDKYSMAIIPGGEEYKSMATAEVLFDKAVEGGLDRRSLIIAFGGGVIGDIAGFVASTYMRGIPYIQIPTTLLAHVDSSVGGKVAVNHPRGKNLIGSFYQPRMVISDISTLLTLPARELSNGLAEIIKYGVICDSGLFEYLEANMDKILAYDIEVLSEIIRSSCRIKARFVVEDEKENGVRALLNYGHTIGHGIEASTGYSVFRHGEAVSIGMDGAAMLAVESGLLSQDELLRQRKLLMQAGLPVSFKEMEPLKVLEAIKSDKKNENGRLRMIIPRRIGAAEIRTDVNTAALKAVLERLRA